LLIRHPTIDPEEIFRELDLNPHTSWKVGDPIRTLKGRVMPGRRPHSTWNHIFETRKDASFFEEVEHVLSCLTSHKDFFTKIIKEGGYGEIYLQLPGQVNQGSAAKPSVLRLIADLGLHLGAEVFPKMRPRVTKEL
jgi:uncharacterized protein DUF4279